MLTFTDSIICLMGLFTLLLLVVMRQTKQG